MPVAFFFAEHKEMLHRLSAGLCLSLASPAKRQAKNDRKHSNSRHPEPPQCRPPMHLLSISKPENRIFETFALERVGINRVSVSHVDVKHPAFCIGPHDCKIAFGDALLLPNRIVR